MVKRTHKNADRYGSGLSLAQELINAYYDHIKKLARIATMSQEKTGKGALRAAVGTTKGPTRQTHENQPKGQPLGSRSTCHDHLKKFIVTANQKLTCH